MAPSTLLLNAARTDYSIGTSMSGLPGHRFIHYMVAASTDTALADRRQHGRLAYIHLSHSNPPQLRAVLLHSPATSIDVERRYQAQAHVRRVT